MKLENIELNNIKSFEGYIYVNFSENTTMFTFSGKNGSGKSTVLKAIWLVQKYYFCTLLEDINELKKVKEEVQRFFTDNKSYIKLTFKDNLDEIILNLQNINSLPTLTISNEELLENYWNLKNPNNLILFIDASKGFSEETLQFSEMNITKNSNLDLVLTAILKPESLFYGVYRQLVKDYIQSRLIPNRKNGYFKIMSALFNTLIPSVEVANFSGNHRPGEFVLLGKNKNIKNTKLYDVREFSSGEKTLLSTLTFLLISKSVGILIIDEPENHFHESLLLELISTLNLLCTENGLSKIIEKDNFNDVIKKNKYDTYKMNQIIVSTHSKSLIYKSFSIGENYIIDKNIKKIEYESAEKELRELGLSTIYNKVLLVEGKGDNEALEFTLKDKNIKIVQLNGSKAVIDTFKRIAKLKEYVKESQFVFMVDSDNKPEDFFDKLKKDNEIFYNDTFIKLDKHEFENYLLDSKNILNVINKFSEISNTIHNISIQDIEDETIRLIKNSFNLVYKKELSLRFQQTIETYYSEKIWGNNNFKWNEEEKIAEQLTIIENNVSELNNLLKVNSTDMFNVYKDSTNENLINRCDGKVILKQLIRSYSKKTNIGYSAFIKAVYKSALDSEDSELSSIIKTIFTKFARTTNKT